MNGQKQSQEGTCRSPVARELALDPDQLIIDAHHHLYDRPGIRYLLNDLLTDICSGHDVRATVYVQARSMLREHGPEAFKAVGETAFAHDVALACDKAPPEVPRICAGIVGYADLTLGERVRPVLESHMSAGGNYFKGIRQPLAWDKDTELLNRAYPSHPGLLDDKTFRRGVAQLGRFGLTFDAWLFFHQLPRLTALARDFPSICIILNHCGGVLGTRGYEGQAALVRTQWLQNMRELAGCENVTVKLGGLGLPMTGLGWPGHGGMPANSQALADIWRPWIEPCIEAFGAARCMFESNFPADRGSHSYCVGWNAMKRITQAATPDEKDLLFWRNAARIYRLADVSKTITQTPAIQDQTAAPKSR